MVSKFLLFYLVDNLMTCDFATNSNLFFMFQDTILRASSVSFPFHILVDVLGRRSQNGLAGV